jgi:hypothetical protein
VNRRAFIERILSGAAGIALGAELDIERLLWVPKAIVTVPEMSTCTLITPAWVTQEAARFWSEALMAPLSDRSWPSSSKVERPFRKGRVGSSSLSWASI